jgi:hypothetical protein
MMGNIFCFIGTFLQNINLYVLVPYISLKTVLYKFFCLKEHLSLCLDTSIFTVCERYVLPTLSLLVIFSTSAYVYPLNFSTDIFFNFLLFF